MPTETEIVVEDPPTVVVDVDVDDTAELEEDPFVDSDSDSSAAASAFEDTTLDVNVKELEEPIDPSDRIVVLGSYTLGVYWNTYRDAWGRSLPVVRYGRTVFCGCLVSDPSEKVEVELRLQKPEFDEDKTPRAVAIMRRVAEYGKEMTRVLKKEWREVSISPLPCKNVDEYECPYFSVSDNGWFQRERDPFFIAEECFAYAW